VKVKGRLNVLLHLLDEKEILVHIEMSRHTTAANEIGGHHLPRCWLGVADEIQRLIHRFWIG
jgi:hypothetical protein